MEILNNLLSGFKSLFSPNDLDEQSRWLESIKFDGFLGEGSFGVVLKAIDKIDKTAATAVKIIFMDSVNKQSRAEEEKFSREFNYLVDKRHTNIVSTLKLARKLFSQTDIQGIFKGMTLKEETLDNVTKYSLKAKRLGGLDTICIQMELCGHTLRSWLNKEVNRETSYSLYEVSFQVRIVEELVEGLKFLHQKNIMHRDFKPENIYFSSQYYLPIKIGDFGQCRELGTDSSLSSQVGTSLYRAPEVSTKKYSFQADLFSLGLIIWEVLQLIEMRDRKSLFDRLVNDHDESLVESHYPITNYREVIIKLTKRKVDERAQSVVEIKLNIKKLLRATNSEQLRHCLKIAKEGDIIELDEGEYVGPFLMKLNLVTLRGKGVNTILRNCLQGINSDPSFALRIIGRNCEIICIKVICDNKKYSCGVDVVGSCNTIEDVQFEGCSTCLNVVGNENKGSNLSINNAVRGVWVEGSSNRLDNIRVTEMTGTSINILGSNNEVDTLSCENVWCGVVVRGGNDNKLRNILCHNNRPIEGPDGVVIWGGSGHLVDNLKCTGFPNYGLFILYSTTQSIISNSVCERIWVGGSGYKLINVDAGEVLVINGSVHRLENCKANKYTNKATAVSLIECNF